MQVRGVGKQREMPVDQKLIQFQQGQYEVYLKRCVFKLKTIFIRISPDLFTISQPPVNAVSSAFDLGESVVLLYVECFVLGLCIYFWLILLQWEASQ